MAKKRPKAKSETPMREPKPKKRKPLFKMGDFVRNVEDPTIIVIVTKDVEKGTTAFHGVCVAAKRRQVGEHDRFWLIDRFELIKIKIEVDE